MGNSVAKKRKTVLNRQPGESSGLDVQEDDMLPDRYYIGLYGFAGVGKTSLINSMLYAVKGKLRKAEWYDVASEETQGTHTLRRVKVRLTDNLILVDNRGLTPETWQNQLTKNEIRSQLEGRRGYKENVEWPENDDTDKLSSTGQSDIISCTIFILSAVDPVENEVLQDIFRTFHDMQGVYPVAVITHIDQKEAKTKELKTKLRGLNVTNIYTVENLHRPGHTHLSRKDQQTLLRLVDRCVTNSDRNFQFARNVSIF